MDKSNLKKWWEMTEAKSAVEQIRSSNENILGVVLNKVDVKSNGYYGKYGKYKEYGYGNY